MFLNTIKVIFAQTTKAFITAVLGVGTLYTVIRMVANVVVPMFDPTDRFFFLLTFLNNTEYALWGVVGVSLLFTILRAVIFGFTDAGRFVNDDQFEGGGGFGKF